MPHFIGKLVCIENVYGEWAPIFYKGKTYSYTDQMFRDSHKRMIEQGYNVEISNGEYYYFTKDGLYRHFRSLKEIRKEKLLKIGF